MSNEYKVENWDTRQIVFAWIWPANWDEMHSSLDVNCSSKPHSPADMDEGRGKSKKGNNNEKRWVPLAWEVKDQTIQETKFCTLREPLTLHQGTALPAAGMAAHSSPHSPF